MKPIKILMLIAAVCNGLNFASAQTWTQTSAPTNNWIFVASSADGGKLAAVAVAHYYSNPGPIYISTNSGTTWMQTSAPSNYWHSVASSADGNKLVAVGSDSSFSQGVIFISTDSGNSWTQASAPNIGTYASIASSADGNKLAAIGGNINGTLLIYTSTNSGITWTQSSALSTNWFSLASSADGTKLVAVVNSTQGVVSNVFIGGPIYLSTNSGTTWMQANSIDGSKGGWLGWHAVASSADGTKLAAVDLNHVFTSADSGMTWTQTSAPLSPWDSIASSADGKKLVAATAFQPPYLIYTSTDSGATWTSNNIPDQNPYTVASSADGNELLAVAGGGGIYTLQTTPSPQLNITPTNSSLKLTWIIPSTNLVMQQSSDLASWSDVTNTPVLNLTNLQNEVILPPTNTSSFYRLKTP